jgi:hypothetical protein
MNIFLTRVSIDVMNTSVFLYCMSSSASDSSIGISVDFAQRDAFFIYCEIYIDLCGITSIRYGRPLMLRPWLAADPMVHIHVRDLTFMTPFDVYYE